MGNQQSALHPLKDGVDNIPTNRRTRAEDRRVAQLPSNLLAHLKTLVRLLLSRLLLLLLGARLLRNRHRRHRVCVWVARAGLVVLLRLLVLLLRLLVLLRGRIVFLVSVVCAPRLLLLRLGQRRRVVLAADVVGGEDALVARAGVLAEPPLGVDELRDGDVVAGLEVQVPRVGGHVSPERDGVGDLFVV